MRQDYLQSETLGIGELISQRRSLKVPDHQRDFSWEKANVNQFLDDVVEALEAKTQPYFIGTIVLTGPLKATWSILDGQQRIATTTIIYSSIRNWMLEHGFESDAEIINRTYLENKIFGDKTEPRLRMNLANNKTFQQFVIKQFEPHLLRDALRATSKASSDYLLLDAIRSTNEYIASLTEEHEGKQAVAVLRNLATFLNNSVQVVVLDVRREETAYTIFEALNARGNELSTLDLIKNYVYSKATKDAEVIEDLWNQMASKIELRNADDFLKVYWTSRFGRTFTNQIFPSLKDNFPDKPGITRLVRDLAKASDYYLALSDSKHEIWASYSTKCKDYIDAIPILGSSQVRWPILAGLERFKPQLMEDLLWALIVLAVRYQMVGKKRTGDLEVLLARLANRIFSNEISSNEEIWQEVLTLIPSDEEFTADFTKYTEKAGKRIHYLLIELELQLQDNSELNLLEDGRNYDLAFISGSEIGKRIERPREDYRLANRVLIERNLAKRMKGKTFEEVRQICQDSSLHLTRTVNDYQYWDEGAIEDRQQRLASIAVATWSLPH